MQYKMFPVENDGMSCIITALITDDEIGLISQKMDNLPFSFVAPLNAYND